jgi:hypothetical protein
MDNKCANPDCNKQLHYLREGKVYRFETSSSPATESHLAESHREHFWLCGDCSRKMFLEFTGGKGVSVVRSPARARVVVPRAALAS